MGNVFTVNLNRPRQLEVATLELPATQYELLNAMVKAHITDDTMQVETEILHSKLNYLPQLISASAHIGELNHLAQRLESLSEWELDCFQGLVMMDTIKTEYAPIGIDRLINMTHSLTDCQVIHEAHDDATLGKFYAENDFVSELESVSKTVFNWLDYGKIGAKMRTDEGGVFTPNGYVVQNGEMAEIYQSGDSTQIEEPAEDCGMQMQ